MKIAFLTPEFPHKQTGTSGGIGTSILNLSKGLINLGHEVSVIVFNQNNDEVIYEKSFTIYKVKNIIIKGFSFYCTQLKLQKLINSLYYSNKIDILEAPDWEGMTAFITTKCPIVLKLHGSDTYFCDLEKRKQKKINKFYEQLAIKRSTSVISVSLFTALQTKKLIGFNQPFEVIPNGVDVTRFTPKAEKNVDLILYFGTLIRKKGVLELPLIFNKVVQRNKNAKLILIGKDAGDILTANNSVWQMMQPLFEEEALKNVQYLGEKPYIQIINYIEEATICIFPTFAEAFPVSWLEAMAMQKPVVASNIGWAKEMIHDTEEGFLVHPENHFEFANKVNNLLTDSELRKKIGVKAREKVIKKFSDQVIARQNAEYYSEFIRTKESFIK